MELRMTKNGFRIFFPILARSFKSTRPRPRSSSAGDNQEFSLVLVLTEFIDFSWPNSTVQSSQESVQKLMLGVLRCLPRIMIVINGIR